MTNYVKLIVMNPYQEQKLKDHIERSFPIRNGMIDPNKREIKELFSFTSTVGLNPMRESLKLYLIKNNKENKYNQCLNWINDFKYRYL